MGLLLVRCFYTLTLLCLVHAVHETLLPYAVLSNPEDVIAANGYFGQSVVLDPFDENILVVNVMPVQFDQSDLDRGFEMRIYHIKFDGTVELKFKLPRYGFSFDAYNGTVVATSYAGKLAFVERTGDEWTLTQTVDSGYASSFSPRTLAFGQSCALGSRFMYVSMVFLGNRNGVDLWLEKGADSKWACVGVEEDGKCRYNDQIGVLSHIDYFQMTDDDTAVKYNFESQPFTVEIGTLSVADGRVKFSEEFNFTGDALSHKVTRSAHTLGYQLIYNFDYYSDYRDASTKFQWAALDKNEMLVKLSSYAGRNYILHTNDASVSGPPALHPLNVTQVTAKTLKPAYSLINEEGKADNLFRGVAIASSFVGRTIAIAGVYRVPSRAPIEDNRVTIWVLPAQTPQPTLTPTSATASPTPTPTSRPTSASPTPSQSPSPSPTQAPTCFSVHSSVSVVREGGRLEETILGNVVAGDLVKTFDASGHTILSEVVLIQHAGDSTKTKLLRLEYENADGRKEALRVSPDHYLVKSLSPRTFMLASSVKVDDNLLVMGSDGKSHRATVNSIQIVEEAVRNVLTMNDMIVVDGVLATSHTAVLGISPRVQTWLTMPMKLMHMMGLTKLLSEMDTYVHELVSNSVLF